MKPEDKFLHEWLFEEEQGWKGDPSICYKNCPNGYRTRDRFDNFKIKVPYCTPDLCIYAPTTKMVQF